MVARKSMALVGPTGRIAGEEGWAVPLDSVMLRTGGREGLVGCHKTSKEDHLVVATAVEALEHTCEA